MSNRYSKTLSKTVENKQFDIVAVSTLLGYPCPQVHFARIHFKSNYSAFRKQFEDLSMSHCCIHQYTHTITECDHIVHFTQQRTFRTNGLGTNQDYRLSNKQIAGASMNMLHKNTHTMLSLLLYIPYSLIHPAYHMTPWRISVCKLSLTGNHSFSVKLKALCSCFGRTLSRPGNFSATRVCGFELTAPSQLSTIPTFSTIWTQLWKHPVSKERLSSVPTIENSEHTVVQKVL